MRIFGLIGFPLNHSKSKEFFTSRFEKDHLTDCRYENFEIKDVVEIRDLLNYYPDIEGFNVTIPHKTAVIEIIDEIDPVAEEIGAVNCLKINRKNEKVRIRGYNTDAAAFKKSLKPMLDDFQGKALILGTGGSSRAVSFALKELKIEHLFVSRNKSQNQTINYKDIDAQLMSEYKLIINCTPSGMFPDISSFPVLPYSALNSEHILFDLVYNPEETLFLLQGKRHGSKTKNGLEMLILQAEASWKIWNTNEK